MQVKLSENIRAMRKARAMTQEQLADAMRVTVGAVSKWESGQNTPDIGLILELADFFETSVDVLLGYEWRGGGAEKAVERINALCREKRFDEGTAEAEKALQKYPNSFEVVYNCAVLYEMKGLEHHNDEASRAALRLYEHSIELLEQNTDSSIGEPTIQQHIADVYQMLGNTELALEQLKKFNYGHCNSAKLGFMLAHICHKPDEALGYLSRALVKHVSSLIHTAIAYVDAFTDKGDDKQALEVLKWAEGMVSGLIDEGAVSFIYKTDAMLLTGIAQLSAMQGNYDEAQACLRRAIRLAKRFDIKPDYRAAGIRFYHGAETTTAYDDMGDTVLDGMEKMLNEKDESTPRLLELWDELKREEPPA